MVADGEEFAECFKVWCETKRGCEGVGFINKTNDVLVVVHLTVGCLSVPDETGSEAHAVSFLGVGHCVVHEVCICHVFVVDVKNKPGEVVVSG